MERRYAPEVAAAGQDIAARSLALSKALSRDGYVASAHSIEAKAPLPAEFSSVQLCRGHCPIQQLAAEFPVFCDSETKVFSRLVGVDVRRLSTPRKAGTSAPPTYLPGDQLPRCITASQSSPGTRTRIKQPARKAVMTDQLAEKAVADGTVISEILEKNPELHGIGNYEYGWADKNDVGANARRGLDEEVVRDISSKKNEPEWMLDLRLKGLKYFDRKPMPTWGADLSGIDFDNIKYFVRSTEKQAATWEDLPEDIRNTYESSAFRKLSAAGSFQASRPSTNPKLSTTRSARTSKPGALSSGHGHRPARTPGDLPEYFGTIIPVGDNKFASLNTAVWSGGSFVYVPKGVHVDIPLGHTSVSTRRTWASSSAL